ncbi:streptomycin biosynthesis protein [Streptomyces sp. B1866]|uniref:streptomycin biosynthesis protein n=1 Tax=Streptomyces sp. B1866 TaxID=3075431 RepID=UPI0028901AB4|nr:streptomycin biosynthesis protein [Streptomyces sp. B1866]MDT3396833.1 streptomycin biosynthesis protein [Streptomyces sp. B1866]
MRVIDGMHRVRAALLRGRRDIEAEFFDGDEREAFVLAVEANTAHGLPLSLADRTAAAERIIRSHPYWSDRAIASATGLTAKTVAAVRRRSSGKVPQSNVRVGRDGRLRPLNVADGRRRAGELLVRHPDAPLRQIAKSAGVSLGTVADVRQRLRRGEDPVPAKQRAAELRTAERQTVGPVVGQAAAAGLGPWPLGPDGRPADPGPAAREDPPRDSELTRLQSLRRDPSLRFTEGGRALLRWLDIQVTPPPG